MAYRRQKPLISLENLNKPPNYQNPIGFFEWNFIQTVSIHHSVFMMRLTLWLLPRCSHLSFVTWVLSPSKYCLAASEGVHTRLA